MLKKSIFYCSLVGYVFFIASCTNTKDIYSKALSDASPLNETKTYHNLTIISKSNPTLFWKSFKNENDVLEDYVLVASWKINVDPAGHHIDTSLYNNDTTKFNDPAKPFYTKNYPIFVTVLPDLQLWFQKQKNEKNIDYRLTQLLGLSPLDTAKRSFVLFWVRPQDLIRPCIDTEITDNTCDFIATKDSKLILNSDNLMWLIGYTHDQYYNKDLYKRYPFTQLGYTFDWNKKNKKHIGVSEFVINKQRTVIVAGIYSTDDFLKLTYGDLH